MPVAPCSQMHRPAARRGLPQRLERACLADRILSPEQKLVFAADRGAHVLELEPVRVDWLELDALQLGGASVLDHRNLAVPRIVEEERAFAADHLELVALRQGGAAVEERE